MNRYLKVLLLTLSKLQATLAEHCLYTLGAGCRLLVSKGLSVRVDVYLIRADGKGVVAWIALLLEVETGRWRGYFVGP